MLSTPFFVADTDSIVDGGSRPGSPRRITKAKRRSRRSTKINEEEGKGRKRKGKVDRKFEKEKEKVAKTFRVRHRQLRRSLGLVTWVCHLGLGLDQRRTPKRKRKMVRW